MEKAIALLEVQAMVTAIVGLDAMIKAADVKLIHVEKRLGGRLVTVVVEGSVSAVQAAADAGGQLGVDQVVVAPARAQLVLRKRRQVAVVVHIDDGLDVQHGTDDGGGGADAAAALQVAQVVHGDPVADVQLVLLHPGGQLFDGHAGIALVGSVPDQQTLTQSGAEGVDHVDGALGILFLQFVCGDHRGLMGGAQGGSKGQAEDITRIDSKHIDKIGVPVCKHACLARACSSNNPYSAFRSLHGLQLFVVQSSQFHIYIL